MKALVRVAIFGLAFCVVGALLARPELAEGERRAVPFRVGGQSFSSDIELQSKKGASAPEAKAHLPPRFAPGQTLRYQMDYRSTTHGRRAGIVEDPSAPTQLDLTVNAIVKLEVLDVAADPSGRGQQVRIRGTYLKLGSSVRTDLIDPQSGLYETQRHDLEGRAFEVILDADGNVAKVEGLDKAFTEEKLAANAWIGLLSLAAGLPRDGIVPGQKWSSEQPWSAAAPLTGLTWRTESTYQRNEPCRSAVLKEGGVAEPAGSAEMCAVILNRFQMLPPRKPRDQTPEEYRQRGLRTSGTAQAAGESLTLISLQTGFVMSVTQTSSEESDITVSTADGAAHMQYKSRVQTQSNIRLLAEVPLEEKKPL